MGGLVTIKDSNWLMSWVVPKDPHFINQPKNVKVLWAYALNLDSKGNYINKTLQECTGKEMFEELLYHMGGLNDVPIDKVTLGDLLKNTELLKLL